MKIKADLHEKCRVVGGGSRSLDEGVREIHVAAEEETVVVINTCYTLFA
jgi:nitrogenase molybdenum-iron protein alpha/beta subunit